MGRVRRQRRCLPERRWPDVHTLFWGTPRCLFAKWCPVDRVGAGPYCRYHSRGLRVLRSSIPNAGLGVYTKRAIPRGALVGEYSGELLNALDLRERYPPKLDPARYIFSTEWPDVFIDGARPDSGIERWINDGGDEQYQNVEARGLGARVLLYATRNIARGEELFLSYGAAYWRK